MSHYDSEKNYTLADLKNWNFDGTSLAVLGYPIKHSISPHMHNTALAALSVTQPKYRNWRYFRFEVHPDLLVESLPLFLDKGFHGINLTVPHKTIAFGAIRKIDAAAEPIGAINTLHLCQEEYFGYNTDGFGLEHGIERELGRSIKNSNIVLIGAGGAARAAAIQCLQSNCASLSIINRNQDRLSELISSAIPLARSNSIPITGHSPTDASLRLPENSLLINATSLGLNAGDPLPLSASAIPTSVDLYDMVYNPPMTSLMKTVKKRGGNVANGLTMLAFQGAKSLGHWTGIEPPTEIMLKAATEAVR